MSSLHSLLNPESTQERDARQQKIHTDSRSTSPPAEGAATEQTPSDTAYYQNDIITKPHEEHENCPNTLDCLPDTTGRPQHTLPVILRCAILGSPKKRLTIREIYAAMERKYPYYKTAGPAWKQSVRHHLSLNRLFERQPRPATDPGFGSYWTVNLDAPPGTKRPRKRGTKHKEQPQIDTNVVSAPLPQKRIDRSFHTSAVRSNGSFEDEEEEEMQWGEEPQPSEDEFESEEEAPYHYEPRSSAPSTSSSASYVPPSQPPQQPRGLYGAFSSYNTTGGDQDRLVERLRAEVEGLRRQSSEALSASLRMSDQLAEAQAEASKARAALRAAENRLEDETRRRVEAEMSADEETRRRRAAEDSLRSVQRQLNRGTSNPR
ncbi:hypothetical protein ABKN59_008961 [Abortiporus biennis]